MPSTKRLSSVCHSIAHHAASGLSFIHPHLRRACRDIGIEQIVIDLKRDDPYPEKLRPSEPLRLALIAVRKTSEDILSAEGFAREDIDGVDLQVSFSSTMPDDHCSNCYVTIRHKTGRVVGHGANYLGQPVSKSD